MRESWPAYFRKERQIRQCAEPAGIPKARARQLATQLACRRLPLATRARLAALAAPQLEWHNTLRGALDYLHTLEGSAPPLSSIQLRTLTDGVVGFCQDNTITIDPTSHYFQDAQRGDYLPLALVLHHEQQHLEHGADERAAYSSSLNFLQRHGAPRSLIDSVKQTATRVLSQHPENPMKPCRSDCMCPRCDPEMAAITRMTPEQYSAWLTLNTQKTVRLLRDMRSASPATNDTRLDAMARFRREFVETAFAAHRAVAMPARSSVHLQPPDPYAAGIAKMRDRR